MEEMTAVSNVQPTSAVQSTMIPMNTFHADATSTKVTVNPTTSITAIVPTIHLSTDEDKTSTKTIVNPTTRVTTILSTILLSSNGHTFSRSSQQITNGISAQPSSTVERTMISPSTIHKNTLFTTSAFVSRKILNSVTLSTSISAVYTSSTFQSTMMSMSTTQKTSTFSTLTTSLRINDCSAAFISLSPSNPLFNEPLLIERSQAFSISSSLQLDCTLSLATIRQWTIQECTPLCTVHAQLEQSLTTITLSEIYIPARTLQYGIYQMKLTVTMCASPQLISSAITYIKIVPSPIIVNLVQFGALMIAQKQQDMLTLDPGTYSIDPDASYFNFSNYNYTYFCRIYDINDFPNITIDDPRIDLLNSSCFSKQSNNMTQWQYGSNQTRSELIIFGGSLGVNQTYEFKVDVINIQNATQSFIGHLLVQIDNDSLIEIIIQCVFPRMCPLNDEFRMINPTTQTALTSFCINNCNYSLLNTFIDWNIYYGLINSSTNIIQWILFDNITSYRNIWFFGTNSRNMTATTDLFLAYPNVQYWRFKVIYSIGSTRSIGLINFIVNPPPRNGTCTINPLNGTTSTIFTITCLNWFDSNGIKDYSFYTWTMDRPNRIMLGFTIQNTFQVRMPMGDSNTTILNLIVHIRDLFNSVIEMNMSSISIIPDTVNIDEFLTVVQSTFNRTVNDIRITSNSFIQILYGNGYQNDICQWLISISRILNNKAKQNLLESVANNIPAVSISVSSLNEIYEIFNNNTSASINKSVLIEFAEQLNTLADIRDYLMMFINNLTITNINSIILQATTIVQLTATTNQLTRFALSLVSTRCYQLSNALFNLANTTTYEDMQTASNQISQCVSNVLTGVNIPLQQRGITLDLDNNRANTPVMDYDTNDKSVKEPSLKSIQKSVISDYQQILSELITIQCEQTRSIITNALNVHLNVDQSLILNTSSVIMSIQRVAINTLPNKTIQLNDNAQIRLPFRINFNLSNDSLIVLRCILTPLAMSGHHAQVKTNLSSLLTISFLDDNGNEMSVHTSSDQPFELFIPRDINWIVPPMTVQNVSSLLKNNTVKNGLFNLHFIDITESNPNISISVHFEMHPLNITLGYMLIYKFDTVPQLSSSINQIDGWSLMCPLNLTNNSLFTYFIDNQRTFQRQSIIFGIRELNETELTSYCSNIPANPPISDHSFHFSTNYELRIFTSGCYYLDSSLNWQSDGLRVGPLTNHIRTQCFSTHLSTFAGGLIVFPNPINWKYVFANADFNRNLTVYLTVIVIIVIYIIFLIYSRHQDKKDADKLAMTILMNTYLTDQYLYQVLVFTGIRKNSGANSKAAFILEGDEGETEVHALFDPDRKILQRGSIDSFLLVVPKSLGKVTTLRVWLDNSTNHGLASWFLKYVIIRDLQTMEKFHFISGQWLRAERMNTSMEHILPVASNLEKQKFSVNLTHNVYHNISDEHLWFSVFFRPSSNSFTRVQRCTCCFVLLFTGMLVDILYYDQMKEAQNNKKLDGLSVGPFYFSREQIAIGIISDILLFIPSLFLVMFFRRIRKHPTISQISPILQALSQLRPMEVSTTSQRKKKSVKSFPWWCLFIAYSLSFLMIIVSIVLTIARGIEFGDVKVQKWLGSLIIGFFSSVVLTQPIKVLGLTIFSSLVYRRLKNKRKTVDYIDKNESFYFNDDEENIEPIQNNSVINDQCGIQMTAPRNLRFGKLDQPPDAINMIDRRSSLIQRTEEESSPRPTLTTNYFVENLD